MADKHYKLIDLGSKIGGSLNKYRKKLPGTIFRQPVPAMRDCLAIDHNPRYRDGLLKLGCDVLMADMNNLVAENQVPSGDVWVACNVMEHFRSIQLSQEILRAMLAKARLGVWLLMPSFEQDETGEGGLRKYGLRFSWTTWAGHRSHFCLSHVREVTDSLTRKFMLRIGPNRTMHNSNDRFLISTELEGEVGVYDPKIHGPRKIVQFDQPIINEWSVQIRWDEP